MKCQAGSGQQGGVVGGFAWEDAGEMVDDDVGAGEVGGEGVDGGGLVGEAAAEDARRHAELAALRQQGASEKSAGGGVGWVVRWGRLAGGWGWGGTPRSGRCEPPPPPAQAELG